MVDGAGCELETVFDDDTTCEVTTADALLLSSLVLVIEDDDDDDDDDDNDAFCIAILHSNNIQYSHQSHNVTDAYGHS